MNFEIFKQQFFILKTAFSLKFEDKIEEMSYIKILFAVLKDEVNDADLKSGVEKMTKTMTKQDFNEKFGFAGRPAPADFLKFFGKKVKKELTKEEMAELEVERVIEVASLGFNFDRFKPTNPATVRLLGIYTLKKIYFDLFDKFNEKPKNQDFYKKELIKTWLNSDVLEINQNFLKIDEKQKIGVGLLKKMP